MKIFYFILAGVYVLLDQLSKSWVVDTLQPYESVEISPFLNLVLVFNKGAAFSFLSDAGGWQRWFFSGLALLISVVLIVWILRLKPHEKLLAFGLSLVLGGAIGNLTDRVRFGHVVDFIDVYYQHLHWPAFNLADSAISLGVVLLLWDAFFNASKKTDDG